MSDNEMEFRERFARMEESLKIIPGLLTELRSEVKDLKQNLVTRTEVTEMFRSRDDRLNSLEKRLDGMETDKRQSNATLPSWVGIVLTILGLIATIVTIVLNVK